MRIRTPQRVKLNVNMSLCIQKTRSYLVVNVGLVRTKGKKMAKQITKTHSNGGYLIQMVELN